VSWESCDSDFTTFGISVDFVLFKIVTRVCSVRFLASSAFNPYGASSSTVVSAPEISPFDKSVLTEEALCFASLKA